MNAFPAGQDDESTQAEQELEQIQLPPVLPVLPLRDTVIFPFIIAPLSVGQERSIKLVEAALAADKMLALVAQRESEAGAGPEQLFPVGTAAVIGRMLRLPDGTLRLLVQGISRVVIGEFVQTEPYLKAQVQKVHEITPHGVEVEGLIRSVQSLFQRVGGLAPYVPEELVVAANNITAPGQLADFVASNLNLKVEERQQLLETFDAGERLRKLSGMLNRELEILEIGSRIQSEIRSEMDKTQRQYLLREQIKVIQKELGETGEGGEIAELRRRLDEANLPEQARKEADRELNRLSTMNPAAPDYAVARTYLDWMFSLPWSVSSEDRIEIEHARQVLDEDHFDLEKPKERILDYLAVRKLKGAEMKGPILCFVGPPGVGKTSLGQSIARALGRKFIRMSLGGIRDEAEIRGHRRTYVGALPGRIIQGLRTVGTNNPVFMLDEIDKVGMDFRGDPSAALLEVLDPAQNYTFEDNYLDVPFDLSRVMFITTANVLDPVPPALRDRMEVLELAGYTDHDKLFIAVKYLVPKELEANGLRPDQVQMPEEVLRRIIDNYTREAGVRNLQREIATVFRKVARQVAEGAPTPIRVDPEQLESYLGPIRFRRTVAEERDEVGVVPALAWTEVGGEILLVEASLVPGQGNLILTGKLGDVMQESAKAALTYVRARTEPLRVPADFYQRHDVHVHVPGGAIPKDGPSAGIAMATALASALTRRPAHKDVGMTGEITLRGKVLPIGGVKEKVLAAARAGMRTVILPRENEPFLAEVPEQVRSSLQFVLVDHMDEVLAVALAPEPVEEPTELVAA